MIKNNQIKKYVEDKGEHCPYCESNNINITETVPNSSDPSIISQTIECHDCGEEWKAKFILTDVYVEDSNEKKN